MQEVPQKDYYRLSEVCRYTDTQPYVLRFWQTEFPQLKPGQSVEGQPVYRRRDIDLVQRIKELLYKEEYTLSAARKKLAAEGSKGRRAKSRGKAAAAKTGPKPAPKPVERSSRPEAPLDFESVSRQRYQDAIDEIEHLRLALKEAERDQRKAEADCARAEQQLEEHEARSERVSQRLETLHELLSSETTLGA